MNDGKNLSLLPCPFCGGSAMIKYDIEDTVAETDQLRSEIERLRAAISSLIDAIQDVQCWQGTHVGACIDQACALLPNEPDQGRR